jgi:hypothetical protein
MWKESQGMTPATATQNLNAKLGSRRAGRQGQGERASSKSAPIRSSSPPVAIVRRPGYQGGGYRIDA